MWEKGFVRSSVHFPNSIDGGGERRGKGGICWVLLRDRIILWENFKRIKN